VSLGEVVLYPKDTYDKLKGQKLALTKALQNIDRKERQPAWSWFFNHSRKAQKKYGDIINEVN
jgi:hypothetical protein